MLVVFGCGGGSASPTPRFIRLVDLYRPESVAVRAASTGGSVATEWRFDGSTAKPSWSVGPGIAGAGVRAGKLAGRTTTEIPILHLERSRSEDRDVVHEVHLRARVSAGANLSVAFRTPEKVDLEQEAAIVPLIPWPFNTPLLAGDQIQTYVMRTTASVPASARHLLIRPTDVAGATFEIESVGVVSRRQHLAAVASGLAWQPLGEVYREALVARAPEELRFQVDVPSRARLELALGTMEETPVTFRVNVKPARGGEATALQRTLTTAHRWETALVDLGRFAGEEVTLSLALASEKPGALGFWGTPVVREVPPAGDASATRRKPQGVILIWADTLRRDHLSFYGYSRPTAPVLARMTAEGTLFEDCVAQASWTKASGPALLTSLYPTTHTVQTFNDVLPSSATTIGEVYRQAGYATLSLISIPFVGKFSGMHQGFEEVHEPGSFPELQGGSGLQTASLKSARAQVDRLLPWLESHRDAPFFVLLHVRDPHSPHKPYPPYDTMWADPDGRQEHERQAEAVKPFIQNPLMRRFGMPSRDDLLRAGLDPETYVSYERDWYDGSIRAMDAEIGRLLERLQALGLDRRTLVAFAADHGEEFLEHGRMFHQQSVYGELANVPLVLWGPGVPASVRVAPTVQNIDLMPTLLELSGLTAPPAAQGRSLVPLFSGGARSWARPAVIEASGRSDPTATSDDEAFAVIADGWKLVKRAGPAYELYDHGADPLDRSDVAAQHPDIVARLTRELDAWQRMASQARLKPDAALAGQMNAEDLERLRALGYVQ